MQSAVEAAGSSNLIDHITSKYASDRFVMMVSEPREIAKYSDVLEVWDKAMRAGDGWLREALRNIRSVEGGDAKTRSDVEVGAHETKSVPASDRYVSTTDNQSVVDEIYAQLELASSEINGSNSIGEEERQIALSEIAIFEAAICQPRLAQDLIERFLRFCLEKLSGWIGGAAVGLLIDKLKTLIDAFISSTLP